MVSYNKSFSLIELIIVIAVILLFSGMLLPKYGLLIEQYRLKTEAGKLKDVFELARKKTITREVDSHSSDFNGYEVSLKSTGYDLSLCYGDTCDRNSPIQSFKLNQQTSTISITSGTGYLQFIPSTPGISFVQFRTSLSNSPPYPTSDDIYLKNVSIPTVQQCLKVSVSNVGIITISDTFISC